MDLKVLVAEVIKDGIVDANEVKAIREAMFSDGIIDKDEADAMFQINDAVSGNDNDASYAQLFVDVVSAFVLEDETTPGVVDKSEGDYIVDQIEGDEKVDDCEVALLTNLKIKATAIESPRLFDLIVKHAV
jgi:hypothetical protein